MTAQVTTQLLASSTQLAGSGEVLVPLLVTVGIVYVIGLIERGDWKKR